MKQRTLTETAQLLPLSRHHLRRKVLTSLRPEGARIPLDLDLVEVIAELDPGMIDWKALAPRIVA